MKKNQIKNVEVQETSTKVQETTLNVDGLETENVEENSLSKHVVTDATPKFNNQEWLENNNPLDYINDMTCSSKFDTEREPKIQDGLELLKTISIQGTVINPLLVLLGAWWEVKPARNEIKKMIDAEAEKLGYNSAQYLQIELGKQVDIFTEFQSAIDRIRYAKTYFKPRTPITTKVPTKPISIDNVVYLVPIIELENAKVTFKDDREALKAYLITVSNKQIETEIEEF